MQNVELLQPPVPSADYRAMLRIGYSLIFFTFVVCGGWAAVARLDAAVIASGTVSVESNRKTIQHLEGGIVREILVRDGDSVKGGDTLLKLDPTRNEATDDLYRKQLAVALALEARQIAQRDMLDKVTFPREVLALEKDPIVAGAINDNRQQFESRRNVLLRALDVIAAQQQQIQKELQQAVVEKQANEEQLASVDKELNDLRPLLAKRLVPVARVTPLERQQMQFQGAVQRATLEYGKGQEKLAELKAKVAQLRQDYRQEAANTMPDTRKSISDIQQQLVISQDALKRVDIKAPVAGTVQQLRIFTVGGVVKPGDPILDIVPASDTLVVRTKVSPIDIDRLTTGLAVEVKMPQFQKFESEKMQGTVRSISRDTLTDEAAHQTYYAVEVAVDRTTIPKEIDEKLTPGMTVQTVIPTSERTVLQYLLGPIMNRLGTAMRER